MRHGSVLLAIALVCSSCSTTPDAPSEQQIAGELYVLDPTLAWRPELASTHGRVRLVRDSGLLSGGCPFTFFINNSPVVRLFPGQYFEVALPPGSHEVYITFAGFFICQGDISNQVTLRTTAGGSHTVRTGIRDSRLTIWSAQ